MAFVLSTRNLPPWAPKQADTLVNIVDHIAKTRPSAPYAEYTILPASYSAGYRTFTYGMFANIINGLAWWLEKEVGNSNEFQTLGYLGGNDIRYYAITLAANKVGFKMFHTSPRNSAAAHASLFQATDTQILITPDPSSPLAVSIATAGNLTLVKSPSLDELLAVQHEHYAYNKTYDQVKHEPFVVLHTSGTTGIPKPLVWTHETVATVLQMTHMDAPEGKHISEDFLVQKKLFVTLPPFHAGGFAWALLLPIFTQVTAIIPAAGAIPSVQMVVDGLKATTADAALLAPPFIEELNKKPELLDFLVDNLEYIFFAGGDISQKHGDFVASKIPCFPAYAGSDIGIPPQVRAATYDPQTWKYIEFHPDGPFRFDHVNEDLYEFVIVRKAGKEEFCFTLSKEDTYRNGDLFSPHPTLPGLWSYRGRNDDIIVFLTGEKTNPISMEQHIARLPEVKAALVIGAQRFQAALIVELSDTERELSSSEKASLIEKIWPAVEESNKECPAYARVDKSLILIASPSKPFGRAGKGTVQRRPTIQLYETEIDALYRDAKSLAVTDDQSKAHLDVNNPNFEDEIYKEILSITSWSQVDKNDNLYILGLDSLQTMTLTRRFRVLLGLPQLAPTVIFANATTNQITRALKDILLQQKDTATSGELNDQNSINTQIVKHQNFVTELAHRSNGTAEVNGDSSGRSIILTGSSGTIGSQLLQTLIEDPSVLKIFCLNRPRKSGRLLSDGSSKTTFLEVDFGAPRFGLAANQYQNLLLNATHFIHAAWPVNYSLSLAAYAPALRSVETVIEFAAASSHRVKVLFTSSALLGINYSESIVPEEIFSAHTPDGYSSSKLIAEHTLDHAAKNLHLPFSIARIGQIAAPVAGSPWNPSEWFPSLIISSSTLGLLPDTLGRAQVDWIPVDILSHILTDLLFTAPPDLYQVVNPNSAPWSAFATGVASTIQSHTGKSVKIVSLAEWTDQVQKYAEGSFQGNSKSSAADNGIEEMLKVNPAGKLVEFYQGLQIDGGKAKVWATDKTVAKSPTLAGIQAVTAEQMDVWVKGCLNAASA